MKDRHLVLAQKKGDRNKSYRSARVEVISETNESPRNMLVWEDTGEKIDAEEMKRLEIRGWHPIPLSKDIRGLRVELLSMMVNSDPATVNKFTTDGDRTDSRDHGHTLVVSHMHRRVLGTGEAPSGTPEDAKLHTSYSQKTEDVMLKLDGVLKKARSDPNVKVARIEF